MENFTGRENSMQQMINYVFEEQDDDGPQKSLIKQSFFNTSSPKPGDGSASLLLPQYLHHAMQQLEAQYWRDKVKEGLARPEGRVGPTKITLRPQYHGKFEVCRNPLGLKAQDKFITTLATTGIYKGKWVYEVNVGSSGVMQVGWATLADEFTDEKGVGDTPESYSYDGNRQRAWNVHSTKYGDVWQSGDVITCAMDMEERTISYTRNGVDLGVAFQDFPVGSSVAYFPALSMSRGEYNKVNFGEYPLLYPLPGYSVLQDPPDCEILMANKLLSFLGRLLEEAEHQRGRHEQLLEQQPMEGGRPSRALSCERVLVACHIFRRLTPLLAPAHHNSNYLLQACYLPFLLKLLPQHFMRESDGSCSASFPRPDSPELCKLMTLLDYHFAFQECEEFVEYLKIVLLYLVTEAREPSRCLQFSKHKAALALLGALLSHRRTRLLLIDNLLFDSARLQSVLVYSVDKSALKQQFTTVHWSRADTEPPVTSGDSEGYQRHLRALDRGLQDVERLHVAVVSLLLTIEPDVPHLRSSRSHFVRSLRHRLILNSLGLAKFQQPLMLPLFHALLEAFSLVWQEELPCQQRQRLPTRLFYDASINFLNTNRLGGLYTHLMKTFAVERKAALDAHAKQSISWSSRSACQQQGAGGGSWFGCCTDDVMDVDPPTLQEEEEGEGKQQNTRYYHDRGNLPPAVLSVYELADSVLLLYHYCAHRTLVRAGVAKETLNILMERVAHVTGRLRDLRSLPEQQRSPALATELQSTLAVLQSECDRHVVSQSWDLMLHFAPRKMMGYCNLLHLTANTVEAASESGELFGFVPEYYLNVFTELALGLADNFVLQNYRATEEQPSLYRSVASFLSSNFTDPRIRYTESRDHCMGALAAFVTCRSTLAVLEQTDHDCRQSLVRSLLQPYENRVWAQNNWILVRFWKGSGFAFRYYLSPHLKTKITPKPTHSDTGVQLIKPTPSPVFQRQVALVLAEDEGFSTRFLNSLLNQLNWAFSEFIGMLQEIQNFCDRLERVFIDSRQLRICSTCFELTVSLLRVLEMVVTLAPQLFVSYKSVNGGSGQPEVLLSMLCKLLCHVVNRVSVGGLGCFSHIVNLEIPGLDSLHHFPVLTAAAGILTALLAQDVTQKDNPNHDPVATRALVSEPSFQLSSFEALLSSPEDSDTDASVQVGYIYNGHQPDEDSGSSSGSTDEVKQEPASSADNTTAAAVFAAATATVASSVGASVTTAASAIATVAVGLRPQRFITQLNANKRFAATPSTTAGASLVSTTGASASTTGAPASTTGAPASTTGAPASTTGAPASTTGAPASTTGAPASTTGAPASTTGAPVSTTGASASTTGAPASTTGAPPGAVSMKRTWQQQQAGVSASFGIEELSAHLNALPVTSSESSGSSSMEVAVASSPPAVVIPSLVPTPLVPASVVPAPSVPAPSVPTPTVLRTAESFNANGQVPPPARDSPNSLPSFSLKHYPEDVRPSELSLLSSCISHMRELQSRPVVASPSDGYGDCVICYARPATSTFLPCAHTSCRACVTQHLMSHKDCFFCMAAIASVRDEVSGKTYYPSSSCEDPTRNPSTPSPPVSSNDNSNDTRRAAGGRTGVAGNQTSTANNRSNCSSVGSTSTNSTVGSQTETDSAALPLLVPSASSAAPAIQAFPADIADDGPPPPNAGAGSSPQQIALQDYDYVNTNSSESDPVVGQTNMQNRMPPHQR